MNSSMEELNVCCWNAELSQNQILFLEKILHREHGAFEQQYLSVLTFPIEDLSHSQDFRFAAHSLAKFY